MSQFTRHAVTVTFMLDISEKDLVKLCLLFYNVIRGYQCQKVRNPMQSGIKGEIPIKNGKECSENAAVIEE